MAVGISVVDHVIAGGLGAVAAAYTQHHEIGGTTSQGKRSKFPFKVYFLLNAFRFRTTFKSKKL